MTPFGKGVKSCNNYDILQRTSRKMCLCTAMICDLKNAPPKKGATRPNIWKNFKQFLKQRKEKTIKILKSNKLIKAHE